MNCIAMMRSHDAKVQTTSPPAPAFPLPGRCARSAYTIVSSLFNYHGNHSAADLFAVSHRRSQDFVWGALFLLKKVDDLF